MLACGAAADRAAAVHALASLRSGGRLAAPGRRLRAVGAWRELARPGLDGYSDGSFCVCVACLVGAEPWAAPWHGAVRAALLPGRLAHCGHFGDHVVYTIACGSMVLYFFCRLFFRPAGRKNNLQRVRNPWLA